MDWKKLIVLSICLSMLISCEEEPFEIAPVKKGGVAITFDDAYVSEWNRANSKLEQHNWKATFCVTFINKLKEKEIDMLIELKNKGHAISGHGLLHLDAVDYCKKNGTENYINTEITPMLDLMGKHSFNVRSFAYPHGERNGKTDKALLNHFDLIRASIWSNKNPMYQKCYFSSQPLVYGFGIDDSNKYFSREYLTRLLDYAKEKNAVLILYAHNPVDQVTKRGQVKMQTLDFICRYVNENNMDFYTLNDLADML